MSILKSSLILKTSPSFLIIVGLFFIISLISFEILFNLYLIIGIFLWIKVITRLLSYPTLTLKSWDKLLKGLNNVAFLWIGLTQ